MPPKGPWRGRRGGGQFNGDNPHWRPIEPQNNPPESSFSQAAEWDISPTRAAAWEAMQPRNMAQPSYNWNSRNMAQRSNSWSSNPPPHQHSYTSAVGPAAPPPPAPNASYAAAANAHTPRSSAPAPAPPPSTLRPDATSFETSTPRYQAPLVSSPSHNPAVATAPATRGEEPPPLPVSHGQPPVTVPVPPSSVFPSTVEADPNLPKKKKNKKSKKKNRRRQSFAAPSDTTDSPNLLAESSNLPSVPEGQSSAAMYRLGNPDLDSDTSMDSEALLDHREQNRNPTRARRPSVQNVAASHQSRPSQMPTRSFHQSSTSLGKSIGQSSQLQKFPSAISDDSDEDDPADRGNVRASNEERTPLLSKRPSTRSKTRSNTYGGLNTAQGTTTPQSAKRRKQSTASSASSRRKNNARPASLKSGREDYDVNNPPSRPASPRPGSDHDDFDPLDYTGSNAPHRSHSAAQSQARDAVIDIENDQNSPRSPGGGYMAQLRRRGTDPSPVEDVCIPFEQMTEIGEEDESIQHQDEAGRGRRRRKRQWPDLSALEEWSQEEKEEFTQEGVRAKKVDEPVLVGGRLRPQKGVWQREVEDAPFRWTYFNEEMDTSLRSHTISGLQQLGHSFKELFIPDPPEIEDESSDDDDDDDLHGRFISPEPPLSVANGQSSRAATRQSSLLDPTTSEAKTSSGDNTPRSGQNNGAKPKKYGPPPVFWLDVLQPTWEEMRVLSRAFGIHKLTAEDIMEQEAREKVELFRTYYFVNYRTFEQDERAENYMDPVNMYFVVFKGGVISFHFSQMPHPPNVRRRIRQLAEHQYTDSDWIAYAIIDNITDAYAPLIEQIETEVDDIDDEILQLNSRDKKTDEKRGSRSQTKSSKEAVYEKVQDNEQTPSPDADRDMLLRVGECRKRVMGLYRLLGSKADVIKGLAKRCNEQWEVAPRSDVGLYLGDIQDHIVTMTGNLSHYENILSRAHSNYLAQINIGMNERAEVTADVLGKLTVVGTIVLPMNVICGMWGMNVLVPGQGVEDNLNWFWAITAGLVVFGIVAFFVARKFYRVV